MVFCNGFATLAYVFLGGFLAVSWTDTIQAAMMCLALIIAPVAVMIDLGGFSATVEQVRSVDPTHLNMLQGQTFIGVISLLAWGLGYFGQPHILVRFMAAKNASVMPRGKSLLSERKRKPAAGMKGYSSRQPE